MTNWFFVEVIECLGTEVSAKVQYLADKYQTDSVLLKHNILQDDNYRIEVWYNLFSERHIINIFRKGNFTYEEDEIIDANVTEI